MRQLWIVDCGLRIVVPCAHVALAAGLLLVLAGCGKSGSPPPPPPPAQEQPTQHVPERVGQAVTMKGIDLYMHDSAPTEGEKQKPSFWVHAETFATVEEKIWEFEVARAVIYPRKADGDEIKIEAAKGRYQDGEKAYLSGGVILYARDMKMTLQDLEWTNEQREARTDHPLTVEGPENNLKADTMRLYPDKKQFILTHATGTVKLRRQE